jgi:hypothetical protein
MHLQHLHQWAISLEVAAIYRWLKKFDKCRAGHFDLKITAPYVGASAGRNSGHWSSKAPRLSWEGSVECQASPAIIWCISQSRGFAVGRKCYIDQGPILIPPAPSLTGHRAQNRDRAASRVSQRTRTTKPLSFAG